MRADNVALFALSALGSLATVTGCAPYPVAIAAIVDDAGTDAAVRCFVEDAGASCSDTQFCSADTCVSTEGTCETIPPSCQDDFSPQCGCDGVSYFNECLRQTAKINVRIPNASCEAHNFPRPCERCGPTQACAQVVSTSRSSFDPYDGMFCPNGHFGGADRDGGMIGTCWVLPSTCSPSSAQHFGALCSNQCTDPCTAIQSGGFLLQCDPADASAE